MVGPSSQRANIKSTKYSCQFEPVSLNNGGDLLSTCFYNKPLVNCGTRRTIYHTKNNNTIPPQLTASTEGVRIWMMHLMSGRAACIAECNMKPATSIPKLVVPCSTTEPCISIFTRLDAVISWYSIPNGFTRKCSWSWFNLACNRNRTHKQFHSCIYRCPMFGFPATVHHH